ncbi:hypothetical protein VTO42DRAFT_6541 [Malbranchea cinnamomea]
MICRSCRIHLLSRLSSQSSRCTAVSLSRSSQQRLYSTPAADSSTSSTSSTSAKASGTTQKSSSNVVSSVPAGTVLQGLNYFKNKPDIVALEDSEYPAWLWTLLDSGKNKSGALEGDVDMPTMNKKQRKRYEKKLAARMANEPKSVPLHEQSIDITPAGAADGVSENLAVAEEGVKARKEITKSARAARRKAIKEDNFLRSM